MSDEKTIGVYDAQATKYVKLVSRPEPDQDLRAFMDAVPAGGRVLDFGCGPGNSAAMMRDAGFVVDATDGSAEMVRVAAETFGITVQHATFDTLDASGIYDGIWANFSLLHAPKAELDDHLTRIHKALKLGGVFHIGTKLGTGEERDKIGRLYSYYQEDELLGHLIKVGFTPRTTRHGRDKGLSGEMADFIIVLSDA